MRNADPASHGRDVHNMTTALPSHLRQHGERKIHGRPEHHVHRAFKVRMIEAAHRPNVDVPGIVQEHVNFSEVIDYTRD